MEETKNTNALLAALDDRWAKFRSALKTCRAEFSEEAVHDLRVDTRRLLAVFDLLRAVISSDQIQKARRDLKNHLDNLDDLRDAQVLLADIEEYIQEIPELKPFRKHLQAAEKKLLKKARRAIDKEEAGDLSKRVKKTREKVEGLADSFARLKLLDALDESYARVLNRYAEVEHQDADSIHRLRIAFKKFRYAVEIVFPLLENFPSDNLERMRGYQTLMGDVQDMDLALHTIDELREAQPDPRLDIARQSYQSRLKQALSNYLARHNEVSTFWRSTPNQPFPWEQ